VSVERDRLFGERCTDRGDRDKTLTLRLGAEHEIPDPVKGLKTLTLIDAVVHHATNFG
jgi:hypothetical protein